VAIAESCFNPEGLLGAKIEITDPADAAAVSALFNESQSRIVISCAPNDAEQVLSTLKSKNVPHQKLGLVGTETLSIKTTDQDLAWRIAEIHDDWFNAIRRAVESEAEPVRSL
jgi:phosphoribosylformylglycinamidine (FGAM) synthase-like enzyme